jgi:hypothetical protein
MPQSRRKGKNILSPKNNRRKIVIKIKVEINIIQKYQ